jgi:hypothetical protein
LAEKYQCCRIKKDSIINADIIIVCIFVKIFEMHFRKTPSLLLIAVLVNMFVFKASTLYALSFPLEAKNDSNELSQEQFMEMQHLPFIFINKQNITESVKLDSGPSMQVLFGLFAKKIGQPEFFFPPNLLECFILQAIPIFIRVRSLRN